MPKLQSIIVLLSIFSLNICNTQSIRNEDELFKNFTKKYNKAYAIGSLEFSKRKQIFMKNVALHKDLNAFRGSNDSAWYGITKFSDLTQEEFEAMYLSSYKNEGMFNKAQPLMNVVQLSPGTLQDLPKKWDWRNKGIVTGVKNQESCGGCWAYATVEVVESMRALATSDLRSLSVQEVLDCSYGTSPSLWGCKGGNTCSALQWMRDNKVHIVTETTYPTTNKVGPCLIPQNTSTSVVVKSYTCEDFSSNEEGLLSVLATHGPVSVSVDATMWNNYQGGVVQHHCGETTVNHAVEIVGYDTTGEIPYYIAKNSWGSDFGIDGYIYLEVGKNMCSLAAHVSAVTLVT